MADLILTWNALRNDGNKYSIGPTYYISAEYEPVAVRIYAEEAPDVEDAEFNIYDDGASIFKDRSSSTYYARGGVNVQAVAVTNIFLPKGETESVDAEDFDEELVIASGSWVSCNLIKDGGGRNFTVQLELERISEGDEDMD